METIGAVVSGRAESCVEKTGEPDMNYESFLKELGEFVFVEDEPAAADIIFVPGNGYPQMAERAAMLFGEGCAPLVLPSGRYSITSGKFGGVLAEQERYGGDYETECDFLCEVLKKNGVPDSAILREDQATYTYENAILSRRVTDAAGLTIQKAILCCKTHHARRALLYYQKEFPETEFLVCPSDADGITRENWRGTKEGVQAVTEELTRILYQFEFLMK